MNLTTEQHLTYYESVTAGLPGRRVMVYHDPITRQDPEGEAEILSVDVSRGHPYYRVIVHFPGDYEESAYYRTISTHDLL